MARGIVASAHPRGHCYLLLRGGLRIQGGAAEGGSKAVQQRADSRRCSRGRTVNGRQQGVMCPRTSASRGGRPRTTLIVHSSSLCMRAREWYGSMLSRHVTQAQARCARGCVATGTSFSLGGRHACICKGPCVGRIRADIAVSDHCHGMIPTPCGGPCSLSAVQASHGG